MPWKSEHIKWLVDTEERLETADHNVVEVWEFQYNPDDDEIMSAWAKHFRNHYCLDSSIDVLRDGTGQSRGEYLENIIFPDPNNPPGPSIRSGDFGEILVADFLEFILGNWVPRTRYGSKDVRNESTKGCDIIGFKFLKDNDESPKDTMTIFEVKAQLTRIGNIHGLQVAISDSAKDQSRKAESLNAIKQRLIGKQSTEDASRIARFQNPEDNPYREISGAAALFSSAQHDPDLINACNANNHPNQKNLKLLVIHGEDMMPLVHDLYRRAANEA